MIVIETCPECGGDLYETVLLMSPPIHKKVCIRCGWSWKDRPEPIIRIPFNTENKDDEGQ